VARSRHGAHSVTPVIDWLLVAALGYQTKMAPAVGCKMRWPLEGVSATAQKSLQGGLIRVSSQPRGQRARHVCKVWNNSH